MDELGVSQKQISIYSDSHSVICSAKNLVFHVHTNHIDVRYHFMWEIISEGRILLQKIGTAKNPADMLTKVMTTMKFNNCLDLINIAEHKPNNF